MKTKNLFLVFSVIALMLTSYGCKKKDNSSNPSSTTTDPCAGITCGSHGHCVNGQCVCDAGYTGADCSQQKTPISITITKIEVIRFPATDGTGAGWDLSDGADIFPTLSLGSTVLYNPTTYYNNASQNTTYPFVPSPTIQLTNITAQYQIDLYDYDSTSSNDWMGGILFTPYSSTGGFPSVLTIDAGGTVAFKVYVSYAW